MLALWVDVNEQDLAPLGRERSRQIDGGCCLPNATFLIGDGLYLIHFQRDTDIGLVTNYLSLGNSTFGRGYFSYDVLSSMFHVEHSDANDRSRVS